MARRTLDLHRQVAGRQTVHAVLAHDVAGDARADRPGGVTHRIGELHLLAAFEQGRGVAYDLGVQGVGHLVTALDGAVGLVQARIGPHQQGVQIQIVQMLRPARDLLEQIGAADHILQGAEAKAAENLTHFLGDEGE